MGDVSEFRANWYVPQNDHVQRRSSRRAAGAVGGRRGSAYREIRARFSMSDVIRELVEGARNSFEAETTEYYRRRANKGSSDKA